MVLLHSWIANHLLLLCWRYWPNVQLKVNLTRLYCLLLLQGKVIKGAYRFHAVITTFEMILADCPELRSVPWRCVVIDEAHRLKNRNCKLLEGLKMMDMVSFDRKRFKIWIKEFLPPNSLLSLSGPGAQSSVDRNSSPEYCGGALQLA